MVERRALGLVALALMALALPATALALSLGHSVHRPRAKASRLPVSNTASAPPEIGALYASARATTHGCTASVVHSPRGDTLLTAAHCVSGSGAGMMFVPGQQGAQAPHGRWIVTAAYLEPKWISRQDPDGDVAFLTVAPQRIKGIQTSIETVTGSFVLGKSAVRGQKVAVTGYPAGSTNNPITCVTRTYLTREFPSFDCRGYVGGTSGTPWLRLTQRGGEIVGVIGGLNQGGCHDYTSYSSPLARDADDAYRRASDHDRGDRAPPAGADGC